MTGAENQLESVKAPYRNTLRDFDDARGTAESGLRRSYSSSDGTSIAGNAAEQKIWPNAWVPIMLISAPASERGKPPCSSDP
jgi:hypothetical protein